MDIEKKLLPDELRESMMQIQAWGKENARIGYDTFKEKYAYLFLAEEPVDMGLWVKIAGSVYTRVDVIKNNQVVYTIPPLMLSQVSVIPEDYDHSMAKVQYDYSKQYEVHPEASLKTIHNGIRRRLNPEPVSLEDLVNWNKFLVDMGRDPIDLSGVVDQNQQPAVGNSRELDIIVEEEDL